MRKHPEIALERAWNGRGGAGLPAMRELTTCAARHPTGAGWGVVHGATLRNVPGARQYWREPSPPGGGMPADSVRVFRWDQMPKEKVTDLLDRRLITGERMMLAHVYLKKGCIVPKHQHENEQLTYVLEGALRFWIGEDGKEELVVGAGGGAGGHAGGGRLQSAPVGLVERDGHLPTPESEIAGTNTA